MFVVWLELLLTTAIREAIQTWQGLKNLVRREPNEVKSEILFCFVTKFTDGSPWLPSFEYNVTSQGRRLLDTSESVVRKECHLGDLQTEDGRS